MSATTNIVINDGTSNLTFNPLRRINGRLQFLNRIGLIAAAYKGASLYHDLWSARRPTTKVEVNLDFPLERIDAINPSVVTAADTARYRGVYTIPKTMTDDEREAFHNLVKNFVASTVVMGYVVSDDPML